MAKIVLGENLITDPDEQDKLTRAEMAQQAVWWIKHETRKNCYPTIGEQLDMQYHDGIDGTTVWADTIAKAKADNSLEAHDVLSTLSIDATGSPYDATKFNNRAEEDAEHDKDQRGDHDTDEDIRNGTTSRQ